MFNKRTEISKNEVSKLESSSIFEKIKDIDLSKINMKDYEKPYKNNDVDITTVDRIKIKVEQGWSREILDSIKTRDAYEIYKNADLIESKVNDRPCLIKKNIDLKQKDERGRTNAERMEKGLSLIDKNGETIELHHMNQRHDSPLAELTQSEHRGRGNDTILHDKTKVSEINRMEFNFEKQDHWKDRVQKLEGEV